MDTELVSMEPASIRDLFARYREVRGDFPHEDHEPTPDQLSAVSQLIQSDVAPYVDFSIFGPHGKRMLRKLHLISHTYDPSSGEWRRQDLPGPPDMDTWWRSWMVFRTTMLLLQQAKAEPLDLYGERMRDMATTYGQQCWFIIYNADVRMRHEEMERIRRRTAIDTGSVPDWNQTFLLASKATQYWDAEVRDKCLLYLTRIRTRAETVDDGTSLPFLQGSPSAIRQPVQPPPASHNVPRSQRARNHNNARGSAPPSNPLASAVPAPQRAQEFCNNWNKGLCVNGPCPLSRQHVCSLCNGQEQPANHRRINCPRNTAAPQQGIRQQTPPPKGKGKGKAKGKGKGRN